jgi:hypothetical protein
VDHAAGDFEAIGLDDVVSLGLQASFLVGEEPCKLDDARPIVEAAHGGIEAAGQAGGLGVEEKVILVGWIWW